MPFYEYECAWCEERLTKLQQANDAPLRDCPQCQIPRGLKKLVSSPSFRLKGSGWYATDFKTPSPKPKEKLNEESGGAVAATEKIIKEANNASE